jgi:hypothetical protein
VPTFAGQYLQEPSDLSVVCTEAAIIAICDDAGGTEATGAQTFADLTVDQEAAIVAVMNSMLLPQEELLESYARRRGYAIPLNPVDATAKNVVVELVWIPMRVRAGRITAEQATAEKQKIENTTLEDIAKGRILLTAAMGPGPAPGAHIYRLSSAHQRDPDGRVFRLSRKSMGRL